MFGIVLWAGSITSVTGASYTSVFPVPSRTRTSNRSRTLLVFAGAFNGVLLPIGIAVLLWVATRRATCSVCTATRAGCSRIGWLAPLLTLYLAVSSIRPVLDLFS